MPSRLGRTRHRVEMLSWHDMDRTTRLVMVVGIAERYHRRYWTLCLEAVCASAGIERHVLLEGRPAKEIRR